MGFYFYFHKTIFVIVLLTAIIAALEYKTIKNTPSNVFLPFIWFVFVIEVVRMIPTLNEAFPDSHFIEIIKRILPPSITESGVVVGSVYSIISFYFYLYYFKRVIPKGTYTKRWYVLFALYTVFVLISLFNYNDLFKNWLQPHMYAGVFCTLAAIFAYMQNLLRTDLILNFKTAFSFWFTMGVLFFNLITIPIFIFAEQFNFSQPFYIIVLVLSCYVMYGCFMVGLIIQSEPHE
ncbi:hypothetical protein SAMN04487906_0923 [Zhouia amylolytica]|uniref:Uncharacterized protein n=1 Tax=Zhouia amylolytica TaxID=376730 RepID=A0A1I6QVT7_9FLAO|nr:hypothetical protein SAMN04487906_0923 [Zhouia amylolytica]